MKIELKNLNVFIKVILNQLTLDYYIVVNSGKFILKQNLSSVFYRTAQVQCCC